MKYYEGNLVAEGARIGVVCARFNELIVSKLLSGCADGLLRRGVREEDIHVAWVPGAFEIPLVASKMAKSGKYDAVIALGAVIRGSNEPLRLCVRGGVEGHCPDGAGDRRAGAVRRPHDRHDRAGD